jgi:hypothetical protein
MLARIKASRALPASRAMCTGPCLASVARLWAPSQATAKGSIALASRHGPHGRPPVGAATANHQQPGQQRPAPPVPVQALLLQLLLDIAKAYNALADVLPLLPTSVQPGSAPDRSVDVSPRNQQRSWRLHPALATALTAAQLAGPLAAQPASAAAAHGPAGAPALRLNPGRADAKQLSAAAGAAPAGEGAGGYRSRSLRAMLAPSSTTDQRPAASLGSLQGCLVPPSLAASSAAASGATPSALTGANGAVDAEAGAGLKPQPPAQLPQMIRVRWDDRTNPYEPCLEAVPPAPGEPTWQERAARAAEHYGVVVALTAEPPALTVAAAPGKRPRSAAAAEPGEDSAVASLPAAKAVRLAATSAAAAATGRPAATSAAAAAGPAAGPPGGRGGTGGRAFFDLMAGPGPRGPRGAAASAAPAAAAVAPALLMTAVTTGSLAEALGGGRSTGAAAKRRPVSQAMVPLRVRPQQRATMK